MRMRRSDEQSDRFVRKRHVGHETAATGHEAHILATSATSFNPGDIGLQDPTTRCNPITMDPDPNNGYIECTLVGTPKIAGSHIRIERNSAGHWTCTTDVANDKYKPAGCT